MLLRRTKAIRVVKLCCVLVRIRPCKILESNKKESGSLDAW